MNEKEYLNEIKLSLKEAVEFFSPPKKQERERWVCKQFLTYLGIAFDLNEIIPADDPPDVLFRDASFEIKLVLDPWRKMHDDYKSAYKKSLTMMNPAELLEPYSPQDITPLQIGELIIAKLNEMVYDKGFKEKTDILFYVNKQDVLFKDGPLPAPQTFSIYGWRSVSVLEGNHALVLYARTDGPTFLTNKQ